MRLGGGEDRHFSQMMNCIFSPDGGALATWIRLNDPNDYPRNFEATSADIYWSLYHACIHGVTAVLQELLVRGADTNTRIWHWEKALQDASQRGHYDIARLLLENGADENALGDAHGKAPQVASWEVTMTLSSCSLRWAQM